MRGVQRKRSFTSHIHKITSYSVTKFNEKQNKYDSSTQ